MTTIGVKGLNDLQVQGSWHEDDGFFRALSHCYHGFWF